jgi:hypothetical protein
MDNEEVYLKYLGQQIAITQNWIARLQKKIWFLEESFKLERDKIRFEKTGQKVQEQIDMFA